MTLIRHIAAVACTLTTLTLTAASQAQTTTSAPATSSAPTTLAAPQLAAVGPYEVAAQTIRLLEDYLATSKLDTAKRADLMKRLTGTVSPRTFRESLNQLAAIIKKMPTALAARYGNLDAETFRTQQPERYEKARIKVAETSIANWLTLIGYYAGHIQPLSSADALNTVSRVSNSAIVTFRADAGDGHTTPILFRVHCIRDDNAWYVEKIILEPTK